MNRPLRDPAIGSAAGWPLVLYFHHVHPAVQHYTALAPDAFRRALEIVLSEVGPAVEPGRVGPSFVPPDGPSVLITFDDGYRDNLVTARSILAEFDVRVLLFCVTGALSRASGYTEEERAWLSPRHDFLTWAEAAELTAAGHVLSGHTLGHPRLIELSADEARREVLGSLAEVAASTSRTPTTFAYPYGLVPDEDVVPKGVLGFGTVKSAPLPWTERPRNIRRTYLPADDSSAWRELAKGWRRQWYASR
ncbi:polysaccharide deacetylase family protein [Allokutzneria sp. A3M-2-11 16]|uniref:polysaccharide deacetylase family protein n=1 Tax=Allokutzneria sp. A3M-2-11 16 TaxID=2962043 RepID=UPI0020B6CFE3|nr:polysaccharide deacetylase family protein [Allokutzneria sp. A3M-2-11 16]MCP3798465.1 polysaccharide deacetylase family protein [Allokutzneria sp. A3M-2-11 16]